ncbi:NADH dehydrogenase (ubiquinone) 1 beta subcomplex, 6, 17kDa [Columba livia]|uniref:NADH dehydrogenase (Ubiquinone) 1 beta subcomplex, 6, 17kDa n=1 Tax=Columba livia TaxID=8932 RepID=A0A2I0LWU7_COLLI|nr:NADH dehydrogenase (ubiquinone) 1 beta subcomplex, 6, 17kDa [Columba livia]
MSGYSEDEKLRLQQLRVLRRRWLRDQELSERPAAAAGGAGGRVLGAVPAARGALAATGVQGLPERRVRPAAGPGPRLGHLLLPEVPRHENAARCCYVKSTDIPRGQDFRDWRNYATLARRT